MTNFSPVINEIFMECCHFNFQSVINLREKRPAISLKISSLNHVFIDTFVTVVCRSDFIGGSYLNVDVESWTGDLLLRGPQTKAH